MNITSLVLKLIEPRLRAFERSTRDPVKTQEKVLFEYLRRNKDTEYGRKYGFAAIRSVKDYQRLVPLIDYEAIRPLVMRMAKGEQKILTRDRPTFFGTTSGTTNLPKFIPTTRFSEKKKADLLHIWSAYIARAHPDVIKGKVLAIISPEVEGTTESGVRHGAETGHGYRSLPGPVRKLYALPPEVFDIEDYDARYYAILRVGMAQDVTDVATLNPNTIVLLCQKIGKWKRAIIDDIRAGTLSREFPVPGAARKAIEKTLRPDPGRADELERILAGKGSLLPKDFWPNMKIIECWKGGMMKLYLRELDHYFGDIPKRDMGCLSTEARSSIPMGDEGASGALAIMTNFYEFIPRDEIDSPEARALLCTEVEPGREYYIIVTTPGGLYRYNIDDIVRVTGWYNRTPTIEFVQKGHSSTSIAGEKLYESQVNDSVGAALAKTGIVIEFFCAVAEIDAKRYAFLVEFSGSDPSGAQKREFFASVDRELSKRNMEYEWLRKSGLLKPPVLIVIRRGDFEKYRAMRVAQGAHDGQFKAPELTADPAFRKHFTAVETLTLAENA